jgi:hypothetical protein
VSSGDRCGAAYRKALQIANQNSDHDHQQKPIDASRISQATTLQLEDPRFLSAEELFAADALPVSPDQIRAGIKVADQKPGLSRGEAKDPTDPMA